MYCWRFRLCLHGTGQKFHRSKICAVHTVYMDPSLFWHANTCLHGIGYLRAYSEPAGFFSAIYHVDMDRSIRFSVHVMAPKRKAADDEENDSNDSFVKCCLLIQKFLRHSSATTAPFIKLSHQKDDVRPGLTQCFLCFF